MSLRLRLALLSSLVTLLALAALAVGSGLALERARLADLDGELTRQASTVLEAALANPDGGLPPVVEDTLLLETGASAAEVYRGRTRVWQGGGLEAPAPLDPAALAETAGERRCTCGRWRVLSLRENELVASVGRPIEPIRRTLEDYAEAAAAAGSLAALAAGLVTFLAVSGATAPLRRLARRVEQLESDEPLPALDRRDEVGALARALDRSLRALRITREREARFLADASHELRTPVTALVADLEHTLARPRPPGEDRAALERARRVAAHLRDLAGNLLALSRAGAAPPALVALDLLSVTSEVADRLVPLAAAKELTLEVNGWPSPMRGDPVLLARLVENLISNAIKFTRVGGVRVEVRPDGQTVRLEVEDSGPGVAPEGQADLFEPFRRADPAAVGPREGFGLGLAVVRGVAEAHGGTAALSDGPAGGTRVTVCLPVDGSRRGAPGRRPTSAG